MSTRRVLQVLAGAALLMAASRPVEAQRTMSRGWIVADALGYGALGMVGGFVLGVGTQGDSCGFGPCGSSVILALGGTLTGAMGGAAMAVSARNKIARGEKLTSGHRGAVIFGAVLGGVTVGAVASSLMINDEGSGTPIGSDEAAFLMLSAAGLFGGGYLIKQHIRELDPPKIAISPTVGRKTVGISAQMKF